MSGYLLSVIGAVLICALITAVAPEGKTATSVKGIAKLICVLAIISPIFKYLKTGDLEVFIDKNRQEFFSESVIDTEATFIKYYSEMRVKQTEDALQKELFEKYDLETEISLQWRMNERICIDAICVKLQTNINQDVENDVHGYLSKTYNCEVLIE